MKTASLSLLPLLFLAAASIAAASPASASVTVPPGAPDVSHLLLIGAFVLIGAGALGALVNLLKVIEFFQNKRKREREGDAAGLVSRDTLDEELTRIYERIEERDNRVEDKLDGVRRTLAEATNNIARVMTAVEYLKTERRGA